MSNRKPKILLISNMFAISDTNWGDCLELERQLPEQGFDVITTSQKQSKFGRLVDMVLTVFRERNSFDVAQVDVFSGAAFIWVEAACWALRKVRKPYVLTLHGGNLPPFAKRNTGRVRRLFNSAAAVTTPSHYQYEQMSPYYNEFTLLPSPMDLSAYEFKPRDDPMPKLIWLRAFHKLYNPALAPRFIAQLVKEFPNIKLLMIGTDKGDGSLQAVKDLIKELNLTDHIELMGGVPKVDVPDWINKGDIFINTTNFDNTPISVVEAMACGLCVVTTNVGGIPYLVENTKDAMIVEPDQPDQMADAVRKLLTESGLASSISKEARKNAVRFDHSVIMPQWRELLLKVSGIQ